MLVIMLHVEYTCDVLLFSITLISYLLFQNQIQPRPEDEWILMTIANSFYHMASERQRKQEEEEEMTTKTSTSFLDLKFY